MRVWVRASKSELCLSLCKNSCTLSLPLSFFLPTLSLSSFNECSPPPPRKVWIILVVRLNWRWCWWTRICQNKKKSASTRLRGSTDKLGGGGLLPTLPSLPPELPHPAPSLPHLPVNVDGCIPFLTNYCTWCVFWPLVTRCSKIYYRCVSNCFSKDSQLLAVRVPFHPEISGVMVGTHFSRMSGFGPIWPL